jgi:nitrous oxidase accessory protein
MEAIAKARRLWTGREEGFAPADWPWRISLYGAAILLVVSAFLPLWHMTLRGPQYPGGLELTAYGTHMEGPIESINDMNRYIGVAPIEPDDMIELKLFPYLIGLLVVLLLVAATIVPRKSLHIPIRTMVLLFPIGFLADLQYWLYRHGHDLDPTAPFRVEPFTPKAIGTTNLMQFRGETMVESGFWVMVAAAALAIAGPPIMRFLRDSWQNTEASRVTAVGALALVFGAAWAIPTGEARAEDPSERSAIAGLIDTAEPGDTIVVPAGFYPGQLNIEKPVILVADGEVIIDGQGIGDVVVVAAPRVTLRGFTVQNSARIVSGEPTGIRVVADSATIEDNIVRDVLYGISLMYSDGHTVRNNTISSIIDFPTERRGHAIYLYSTADNLVEGNTAFTAKDGIFVGFGHRNHIQDNFVRDVRYGIHYMYANDNVFTRNIFRESIAGAALMYSEGLTFTDNEFSYNRSRASGYGLLLKDVDDVVMTGNRIHHNRLGMTLEGVPHSPGGTALIADNLIGFNQTAIEVFSTTRVSFTGNTFIGNLRQVESRGGSIKSRNEWAVEGRGNYWDIYQGYDATGDGIGDRPFEHRGAFESLMDRNPELQAFSFTLAHESFEMAARWFAPGQSSPIVVDPAPLMKPTMTLPGNGGSNERLVLGGVSALLVVGLGLAARTARTTLERRWQPC